AVLRAQGLAEARLAMAEAEAEAIRRISSALPDGQASMYLLGLKYLEALPKMTEGQGTTIFLPSEATGVLSALGGLRQVLGGAMGRTQEQGPVPHAARPASGAPGAGVPGYHPSPRPPAPAVLPRPLG